MHSEHDNRFFRETLSRYMTIRLYMLRAMRLQSVWLYDDYVTMMTVGKLFISLRRRHEAVCIGQWAVTLRIWDGNRRSGIALAMHYMLQLLCARSNLKKGWSCRHGRMGWVNPWVGLGWVGSRSPQHIIVDNEDTCFWHSDRLLFVMKSLTDAVVCLIISSLIDCITIMTVGLTMGWAAWVGSQFLN